MSPPPTCRRHPGGSCGTWGSTGISLGDQRSQQLLEFPVVNLLAEVSHLLNPRTISRRFPGFQMIWGFGSFSHELTVAGLVKEPS